MILRTATGRAGKRTLASPGKNMFANAKNPGMMLGSNTESHASEVLDEWSALRQEIMHVHKLFCTLSHESAMQECNTQPDLTRLPCSSAWRSACRKTPL